MDHNFLYDWFGKSLADSIGEPAFLLVGVLAVVLPLVFLLVYALLAILGELKFSAFIQLRLGPMRTGPWGVLQPLAEVVKLLQKEDITPDAADKVLFNLAPFVMFVGAFAGFAALPFSSAFVPSGINVGVFYIFAIGSLGVIGIIMGGWASNNKYSLIGAIRSAAQMVSYEIPIAMSILSVALLAGSLNLQVINAEQSGWFWNWNAFGGGSFSSAGQILVLPFTLILAIIYIISGLAETNRTPFDIPEGESELVAGYHTEYSGMKFAMFFFAEYANMFVVSALIASLFFGGWNSPIPGFLDGPFWGAMWFIGKSFFFVFLQIWLRWTLPRLRVDQLMYVGWKVLVPLSFVCFFAISVWVLLR